jgi:hypothetical protein
MMRHLALAVIAAGCFVSCESNAPYLAASHHEEAEFKLARLEVNPDDVRNNIDQYTNTTVAWAGVIRSTVAEENDYGGKITAKTTFEHHYFDWEQNTDPGLNLLVSPRGEGSFTCKWQLRKKTTEASAYDAEKFARNGKLAIVYGVPESVTPEGTIVLKYAYLRVVDRAHFNTNTLNYGRLGVEPLHPAGQ